jgi:ATP-dependent DNA helicase PIF1
MSDLENENIVRMVRNTPTITLNTKQEEAYEYLKQKENVFITGPAGTGKCLGFDTPILMFDGTIKMIQDVEKGDIIMGDDSTGRKVLSTTIGEDEMYKVTTRFGDSYIINSAHILTFKVSKTITYLKNTFLLSWGDKSGNVMYKHFYDYEEAKKMSDALPNVVDIPLLECIKKNKNHTWQKYFQGVYANIHFSKKNLPVYPYILGMHISKTICQDSRISDLLGYPRHMNLIHKKYIPIEYKTSSREQRLDLLAGIIDSFGCLTEHNKYEIIQTSTQLNDDIYFIARSLGFHVTTTKDSRNNILHYRIYISGNINEIPVVIAKKHFTPVKEMCTEISRIRIDAIGKDKYYGFEIDGNHRFVLGNFIITHNTAVINMFMKVYRHSRKIAITSTTGTSALLLNGTTVHSYLGIGYGKGSVKSIVDKIVGWSWLRKRWNELETLFIDEISMMDSELFDKIEEVARIVRRNMLPFGGIQIILSGDFLQLPCVGSNHFCFEATSWNRCITHTVCLNEIMRQENNVFQEVLNKIRIGKIDNQVKKVLDSRIGVVLNNEYGIKPTGLYSYNRDVDTINEEELDNLALDGRQFFEYNMNIFFYPTTSKKIEALEKFKKYCTAPDNLQLCKGAQVMLLKNLDISNGLANGSRGIITGFISDMPLVRFLNGEERIIEQHVWEVEENDTKILRAQQIPLKVAYAISIHKSQGCTLDYAEIDLSNVFEYGQSYVALSRVKSLEGLSIIDINYESIRAHPKAIEYYETLSNANDD